MINTLFFEQKLNTECRPVRDRFFLEVHWTTFRVVLAYAALNAAGQAWFTFASLLLGILVLTPLTLALYRRGLTRLARMSFVLGFCYYVFAASFGHGHQGSFDYYCLPGVVVAFVLFEPGRWRWLVPGILLPVLTWLAIHQRYVPVFLGGGDVIRPGDADFELINFFGAYLMLAIFVYNLIQANLRRHRDLRRAKGRIEKFFTLSPDLMCILDSQSRLIRVNPSFRTILGYDAGETIGRKASDLVHPEDAGDLQAEMERLSSGYRECRIRARFRHKSGEYRTLSWTAHVNPGEREVFATGRDITPLIRHEQEIRERKQFLEAILEHLPLTVMVKDCRDGFRFNLMNRAGESLLGMPAGKVIGKTLFDLAPAETAAHHRAIDERVLSEKKEFRVEREDFTLPGGTKKSISISKVPTFDENGDPHLIITIVNDITGEIAMQDALDRERTKSIQSAKMATLGEMSAGIAHEINNPLAILSGAVQTLARYLDDPEKIESRLFAMKTAIDRISRIVSGLRKFSRSADHSRKEIHDLRKILREVLILVQNRSAEFAVPVTIEAATDAFVSCNEIEMQQIFINLINNGIDAVRDRDERWVRIRLFRKKGRVVVQIRDSGNGIDPACAEKLFQPFFTTKPVGEGTGLGLSIVKGILDEHHASIELLENDRNTCFELVFEEAEAARRGRRVPTRVLRGSEMPQIVRSPREKVRAFHPAGYRGSA